MSEEIDPSEFVQRIRQLGEQRDQQDAERVKKLEEDLIQGRSERLARRAERARSISPDKPTTPQSPQRSSVHTPQQVQEKAFSTPTPAMSPLPQQEAAAREESLQQLTGSPAPTADDSEPKKPVTSAAALGRSGTLSWKQRPQSGSIRRPLSVASSSFADRPRSQDASAPSSPERPASRAQIAASLGAKDPAYFRQTADRGVGSAAYRRNEEDNVSEAGSISGRRQLPGMSRDSTISRESTISTKEPELASPPTESNPSSRPTSRGGSLRGSTAMSNRFSTATSISGGDTDTVATRSPLPTLDSQKFAPPSESGTTGESGDNAGAVRGPLMSPTQGKISPERERPVSPTKGMGGFVLSASLKRSDSVSKRWSTQAPPTLNRHSSTLSNRGSALAGFGSLSKMERPTSLSKEQAVEPLSRPQSSSSNVTMKGLGIDTMPKEDFTRPALSNRHSRSKSVHSTFSNKDQIEDGDRPASPSKRWSPTKSSWLENALNKPESPKQMAPASPQQPAWMAELNRAKQQRGSVDIGKGSPLGTPFGEKLGSRPTSPIKDVQLRPVSLRKSNLESPKLELPKLDALKLDSSKFDPFAKEETKEAQAKLSLEPAVELRPSSPLKEETKALDEAENVEEPKPATETTPVEVEPAKTEPIQTESLKTEPSKTEPPKTEPPKTEPPKTEPPKTEPEAPNEAIQKDKEAAPSPAPSPAPSKSVLSRFPPAVKQKPVTPPKKDFRAGLKSRQIPTNDPPKSQAQSELQNVFGKLRKAEVKNYVAPDVLKANIVGGKNALNVTGGPKPTVRRDEFRESLKEKRSSMLEKAQEDGSVLKRSESISKPTEVPEAIAVRGRLDRSKSISKFPLPAPEEEKKTIPEALARKKSLRGVERPNLDLKESKPASPAPLFTKMDNGKPNKLAERFNPALAGMLARGPPPLATEKSRSSVEESSPTRAVQEEPSGPAPELTHMTKGRARGPKRRTPGAKKSAPEQEKVTEKVNAAVTTIPLVNPRHILPNAEPPKANGSSEEPLVSDKPARESVGEKPIAPAKARQVSAKFNKVPTPEVVKKPSSIDLDKRVSGTQSTPKQSPRPDSIGTAKTASPIVPKKSERITSGAYSTAQQSPKPESIRSPSITSIQSSKPASPSPSPSITSSRFSRTLVTLSPRESPKSAASKEIHTPDAEVSLGKDEISPQKSGFSSVKNATALWGRQSASSSPAPLRTRSPIKLPTQADEKAAMKGAGLVRSPEPETEFKPESSARPNSFSSKPLPPAPLQPKPKPAGLGFSLSGFGGFGGVASRSRESSPQLSKDLPMSPPRSADKAHPDIPQAAPTPVTPKHDGIFAEFFDEAPVTEGQLPESIDTVHVLHSPPFDLGPAGKVRTQKQQIQEITGDGKMLSIPAHEQHVLFQDSMYLCTHTYSDAKGARNTDVYLWAGNGVAESNVEDAQLFAKNYAKQNQARLLVLRQGNEPPNFFDALGGIVITRRGAKPASKQFMLCGRRHLGHLAFDEVDFALNSFCSAFVYLISTEAGKVFLWKGRGCSAEELSGARLMGMDLAPTGDFQEVDEGSESSQLIDIFPPNTTKGPAIPRSADHWRYKATSDRYRARLYKIDQQQEAQGGWGQSLQVGSFFANLRRSSFAQSLSPTSTGAHAEHGPQTPISPKSPLPPGVTTKVVEIMPFCQRDLEPEYIYVLDAFFEMYIIVGALARSQAPAFSTALMFAQEYGILAVSEEDRPFMPVTTIVLEGVPRDMKAVFRHWNDALIPTAELMSGSLKRGKSLRILGLEKAIRATRK